MTSRLEVPAAPRSGESAPGVYVDVSKKQGNRDSGDLSTRFVWGVGIECSFIPHLNVDQFEWTQHERFWREDLRLAKEQLGVSALRYAFPWHKIETSPGKFDFSLSDERMAEFERLGIEPYLDVMHFGTPLWLKQAAGDPEFPEALERFTTALVERYGGRGIRNWCPCNEPLVVALFSGDFGFWPPHQRKWKGYMPVLSRVVQGVSRSIRAIRRAQPDANVVLCDNVENYKTREADLAVEVRRRNLRRFLVLDLLMGRFDRHHPLYQWVSGYGISELDLEWFRSNPQFPDVLGLDYYQQCDCQLDRVGKDGIRQRRAESPVGLYGIANAYWNRYGIPMMLTETSVDGKPINREIWLEHTVEDCRRLREEGVPMLGYFWWPMIDQVDWDGALTHRIGKVHEVGLFNLRRQPDGTLARHATPLVKQFAAVARSGLERVGTLAEISRPAGVEDQGPPIGVEFPMTSEMSAPSSPTLVEVPTAKSNGNGNGNGASAVLRGADPVPGLGAEPAAASAIRGSSVELKSTDRYGIVVFSHLRWGFVWQRPQQFLSRFAKKHKILFFEEPFFDAKEGEERLDFHKVMPNVTVATPHVAPSWNRNPRMPERLREFAREAIQAMNEGSGGEFDRPLLWYYSPMDSAWSLGHFENRGIVYDCMDELSQFTGAPKALVKNEARLIEHADVLFTGGYELGEKKRKQHTNVHTFGCGVEYDHFARAADPHTVIPADIDFVARPIFGWFGVVDERVDYALIGEVAKKRPDWSFAMVGPVVKVDPNLLPYAPNLFWLGGREYQQLPNYCAAFDVCMMPFAMNAATQYINPTKGLEYMATGRPIVGTHVKDVVRQWSDIVYLTKNNAEDFIRAAEQALRDGKAGERVRKGIELSKQCSWEGTVERMQGLIREAIGKKDRPSAGKIEPLTEAEMEYVYMATQGS
jgi:beta-glucosidase/6-phospho-beta-glucosidase/beta-galactosidase/glycosyltransferase involved in cell wall biosynthesis